MRSGISTGMVSFFMVLGSSALALEALPEKPPVPSANPMSEAKVELGKILYFDKRLSVDNTVSCATCHDLGRHGVDGRATSKGIRGQLGGRNAPTSVNAAYLSVQFWDGRAASLEEQAKGPLTNPIEMGMKDHGAVIEKIKKIPGYGPLFEKAFGTDAITIDQVAQAIASFERTLVTPDSPFDRYQKGDQKALNPQARAGMELFQKIGCVVCHSGPAFAGPALDEGTGFYQKFPTISGSEYEKKYELSKDLGRYEVTKNDSDKNLFRVPTLRNVEKTAPYFHNGKVQALDEAVRVMAKVQLGKDLKKEESAQLVAFLKSLTGPLKPQPVPKMPK